MCVCVWRGWAGAGDGAKGVGGVEVTWNSESFAVKTDVCPLSHRLSQLAHAIRLLLEYTDTNYEEEIILYFFLFEFHAFHFFFLSDCSGQDFQYHNE